MMRRESLILMLALLVFPSLVGAQDTPRLGDFRFDSGLFGNTMTPQTPPLLLSGPWINVVNVSPAPGTYLTGPNFNTGINLGAGPDFTLGYIIPIINRPGPDLGVVTAPLLKPGEPVANFLIVNNTFVLYDPLRVGVNTGVIRDYFFQDQLDPVKSSGPSTRSLFVTPVDLSDFGIAEGEGVQSIRVGSTNGGVLGGPSLATIRVAGFERGDAVAVPELVILHVLGPQLNALLNPPLQHLTAWSATALLRALQISAVQRGIYVDLPSVSLEVQQWCSGLYSMKWLMLLAVLIALVSPMRAPWKVAVIVASPLIAFEANVLRVVAIGAGLETLGHVPKDWMGWGAIVFGAAQVVGIGWLINQQARAASNPEGEHE